MNMVRRFLPLLLAVGMASGAATPAAAQGLAFPDGFRTQEIATNGVTIHTRVGGSGLAEDDHKRSGQERAGGYNRSLISEPINRAPGFAAGIR